VRHEQSEKLLDLRMGCLDRRLGVLAETVGILSEPDKVVMPRAVTIATGLPAIAECGDTAALGEGLPPPDSELVRGAVAAIRPKLDRLSALQRATRYREGLSLGFAALGDGLAVSYPPVRAKILTELGLMERETDGPAAAALLQDAV